MKRKKRHPITLLEIMIVILLIGVIGGVLSYNLKGTLDRGKKFRTEEGIKRLKEILDLQIETGNYPRSELVGLSNAPNVRKCVEDSGFIAPAKLDDFLKDGWKNPYLISEDSNKNELIISQQ